MESVRFGVFADPQYCDSETTLTRFYRRAAKKLKFCIDHFNKNHNLDFIIGLGDLIDRKFESFYPVKQILAQSIKKVYLVAGNHDLEVNEGLYDQVYTMLELDKNRYYSFTRKGWHFIFTDGNDITWHSTNPQVLEQARKMTAALEMEGKPNFHKFNGGFGRIQIQWLENQLAYASSKSLKIVIICHYPLLPFNRYSLWNANELIGLIDKYRVNLWLNGHHHDGNYEYRSGTHYLTLKGMVDTEYENSFAEIVLMDDAIEINGYGREENRRLDIK